MSAAATAASLPSQHMTALAQANRIRLDRAQIKRQVNRREKTVAWALDQAAAQTMCLFDLLAAQQRWGPRRTVKFLNRLHSEAAIIISESRRVCDLTERQRKAVVRLLAGG